MQRVARSTRHKEKGESISDYLWWRGDVPVKDSYVQVSFVTDEGQEVRVRRTPTDFEVVPAGRLDEFFVVPGPALENPLELLCRTAILRDEEITRLSIDLAETDRFDFVRASLGTADFEEAQSSARRVGEILKRQQDLARRDYDLCKDRVSQLTARISQAKSQATRQSDVGEAEGVLRRLVSAAVTDSAQLWLESERWLGQQHFCLDGLRRAHSELRELQTVSGLASVQADEREVGLLEDALRAIDAELSVVAREAETNATRLAQVTVKSPDVASMAQLLEHGRRLGLRDGHCPLCDAEQTEQTFERGLSELEKRVKEASVLASSLSKTAASTQHRTLELNSRADRVRSDVTRLRSRRRLTIERASRVADELRRFGFLSSASGEALLAELETFIANLSDKVTGAESALRVLVASRAASEVLELERELNGAKERLSQAERTQLEIARAQLQLREGTQTIRRVQGELVDEQLAALSPLLVELYERLRPHLDWQKVRYNLRGDVRRMLSLEVGPGLNPNFVFSSGQRRAAGLAFLLAIYLSRSWCKLKTLLLDDPVQHVDDFRALHLTEVLAAIRRGGQQVICTVEDSALAELLVRRLRSQPSDEGLLVRVAYKPGRGCHIAEMQRVNPMLPQMLVAS